MIVLYFLTMKMGLEDMGKEGLRKAKESYNPIFMVKKYNTIIR